MSNSETVKFKGYTIFKNYEAHSKKIIEYAEADSVKFIKEDINE